jgi:glycogen debranching enzyme
LIFGGFGGIIAQLQKAKRFNILSCGIFDSLREGDWLLDYYISRLKRFKHLNSFTEILEKYFECLKKIPYYLRPKYFTDFIYKIYKKIQEQISCGSKNRFHRKILLATTQFISSFQAQNPLFRVTLSAGLPHFSTGWTRCWGRDTFMCN